MARTVRVVQLICHILLLYAFTEYYQKFTKKGKFVS